MTTATSNGNGRVSLGDIEAKLRDLKGDVDQGARTAKNGGAAIGAALAAAVVAIAFVLGKRKARKKTTVVEIRRV